MKILLLTTLLVSCSSQRKNQETDPRKDLAVCKNTLQRDIHINECR